MAVQFKPRSNKQGFVDTTADLATISGRENYTVLVKDYGIFEWLGEGTANSIDVFPGLTGVWSLVTSSAPAGNVAVKAYRALVTQSSTTAPTATVLENSLGGAVVWARGSTGTYTATLAAAFTADKTFVMSSGSTGAITAVKDVVTARTSADVITVNTGAAGTAADGILSAYAIEILVYP